MQRVCLFAAAAPGHRRADIEDMVSAHLFAVEKAPSIGFGRYIVSATTPFTPHDLQELRGNAPAVVKRTESTK